MRQKIKIVLGFLTVFPALAMAAGDLSLTVVNMTNLSKCTISFISNDFFDFGNWVYVNESLNTSYSRAPKNITLSLWNFTDTSYDLRTEPSCDLLGWPSYQQATRIKGDREISGVRAYGPGSVRVTIQDMPDSTPLYPHLTCTISTN